MVAHGAGAERHNAWTDVNREHLLLTHLIERIG